ncbi:MAG: GTPase HflX [Lachnospiraceae bacterium]|nr:GTPase HflX [Lachnospiraceae bacterium]
MTETLEKQEKVILVGIAGEDAEEALSSLMELEELAGTAGAQVLEIFIQSRDLPHPGTYLGSGRLAELKERVKELEADGIICDDELSPAQNRNLEDALQVKVMDRSLLILDIFARRAATSEGKIQVELAQLRYRATRLTGKGTALSRLGGGIGTRGPGESKLETDRRSIHNRISKLKADLKEVVRHRDLMREKRKNSAVPVVAIVGYTNAGKSTLLNTLTGADILAEDKLFATLDPTTRSLALPGGEEVLLTDTVGFIQKLPHHLIDAFKSTLEEALYADVILHVVDASGPRMKQQMETVYATLKDLGVEKKPVITAFNKCDLPLGEAFLYDAQAEEAIRISARTGAGLMELKETISRILQEQKVYVDRVFSYTEAAALGRIRKYGNLVKEEYTPEGVHIEAYVPKGLV